MSYKSATAYHRTVIITAHKYVIRAFLNKEDADFYYMNSDAENETFCANIRDCANNAVIDNTTMFWTEKQITDILWEIRNLSNTASYAEFDTLRIALNQAFCAIMDDEIEIAKREVEA